MIATRFRRAKSAQPTVQPSAAAQPAETQAAETEAVVTGPAAPRPGEPTRSLTVTALDELADGVVRLTLEDPAGGALAPWLPGAHLDLVLGNGLTRQYSLCGEPADDQRYQVAVLREPESRGGSAWIHERLAVDDTIEVAGPRNNFRLVDSPRYLFVAGGIGITPILPMVAAAEAEGADWRLVYGGRTRGSMAYLDLLARYGDRVSVVPFDECGHPDLQGLLGEPLADTLVYTCGPGPLLDAIASRCAEAGWPAESVHMERFRAAPLAADAESNEFTVELARSGVEVRVPADLTILEALEVAGVGEPYSSCREGTCGTCETGVLAGAPDHRDSVLGPAERAAGDVMMICVSRACGERLVLDL